MTGRIYLPLAFAVLTLASGGAAQATTIANRVATFSGLDKITGRVTNFDVYIGETVQFGALQVTPRACYTRPTTETQHTSVFVEVDQVSLQETVKRIFTGWMFADAPALNAVDHPVYDVWLIDCKQTSDVPPPDQRVNAGAAGQAQASAAAPPPTDDTTTGSLPPDAAIGADDNSDQGSDQPAVPDVPADTPPPEMTGGETQ